MSSTLVYRVQPVGLEIRGHRSLTSNDNLDAGPHVFGTIEEAKGGVRGWCSQSGKWELLEIECSAKGIRDNGDYEGYVLTDKNAKIINRQILGNWKQVKEWASE